MLTLGQNLHIVLTNTYTLFTLALGLWALFFAVRSRNLDGSYWGAVAIQSILAVVIFVITLLLTLGGRPPIRWVYWLYIIYFMIVLPSTYALLRGRDDRIAAFIFAGVCFFTFLANGIRAESVFTTPLVGA
jgi:drug/metabolite transporter (DMT)-like permease